MPPDPAPAYLHTTTDIDPSPVAVWNEQGGFGVVRFRSDLGATVHVMSRAQAKALKDAFAAVEAMYAERETTDDT